MSMLRAPQGFTIEVIPPSTTEKRQHTVHYRLAIDMKLDVVIPAEVSAKREMRDAMLEMAATQLARNAIELLQRCIS